MTHVLHGPHGHGTDSGRHGTTPQGEQRDRCRETTCARRTYLLDDAFPSQSPHITEQIIKVARHASGMRDTARVLHAIPTTVLNARKKRHLRSTRCITRRRRCVSDARSGASSSTPQTIASPAVRTLSPSAGRVHDTRAPGGDVRVVHRRLPRTCTADHVLSVIVRVSQDGASHQTVWWT